MSTFHAHAASLVRATTVAAAVAIGAAAAGTVAAASDQARVDLVSFPAPAGWQREAGNGQVTFSRVEGNEWGQIVVYSSARGSGSVHADFDAEWQTLVAQPFAVQGTPETSPPQRADGWQVMSGAGTWSFNGATVTSMLTTFSGHGVRTSILCNATAQRFLQDCITLVGGSSLAVPGDSATGHSAARSGGDTHRPSGATGNPIAAQLAGSPWTSRQQRQHASGMGHGDGRSRNTYRFGSDGRYHFDTETFQYHAPKYYLVDETGTYQLDGDILTLTPARSQWRRHASQKTDPALDAGDTGFPVMRFRVQFTTIHDRARLVLWPLDGHENPRDGTFNYHDGGAHSAYLYDAGE